MQAKEPATTGQVDNSQQESRDGNRFFATAHLVGDLRGRSVRGGAVTLIAQAAKFVLQVSATMVLARLLTPADFGLVAMVTAVTGVVALLKDAGLSMATVQRESITHSQVSTLFWVNVALSLALMVVTLCLAPLLAWFYGEPRLTLITLAIALTFVFGGLAVQHQALLRRQMQFGKLAMVDALSMTMGVSVAMLLAWQTHSYWALVAMPATMAFFGAAGVWLACGWIPGRPRRGSGVMPMLRFGGSLTGSSFLTYASQNIDYLMLGWRWGTTPLGLYRKSYELMMLPVRQLHSPLAGVFLPTLSRLQADPAAFRRAYLRVVQFYALLGLPLSVFLCVEARPVVALLLGSRWSEAAPLFQLLTPAAAAAAFYSAPGFIFLSYGQGRKALVAAIMDLVLTASAVVAGLPWGAPGIAGSIGVSSVISVSLRTTYATRGSPVRVREILAAVLPVVLAAAAMGGVLQAFVSMRAHALPRDLPLDALLGLVVAAGVLGATRTGRDLLRAVAAAVGLGRWGVPLLVRRATRD